MKLLLGNAFPLSLIRRKVEIKPYTINDLKELIRNENPEIYSFWGHRNSIRRAENLLGISLSPGQDRPPVELNEEGYPVLNGNIFKDCWIISPNFVPGYRPAIGEEVSEDKIVNWQVLKIEWT